MGAPIMNDDRKGILEALAACKLFLGTEKKDIERYLLPYGEMQTVGKDGFFFMKEDVVDKLGVILSGRLTLYHLFEDGKVALGPLAVNHRATEDGDLEAVGGERAEFEFGLEFAVAVEVGGGGRGAAGGGSAGGAFGDCGGAGGGR